MSNAINCETCLLCGSSAEWLPGDYADARDYCCTNSDCGGYRIDKSIIETVRADATIQKKARQEANSAKGSGRVLIIKPDAITGVTLETVELSSIRFFRR